jgi:hypothetical protein
MVTETPGITGMTMEVPDGVPGVVPLEGIEKMVVCEAPVPAPLTLPAVPLLGPGVWAWLGNCQITDSRGLRLRAKMRFLMFNMMTL